MATWPNSVVLLRRDVVPMAVLFPPLAVLKLSVVCHRVQRDRWPCCSPPVVLSKKANTPVAVLFAPVVLFKSAPPARVTVLASAVLAKSVPAPTRPY